MKSIWHGGSNFGINNPVIKNSLDFTDYGLLEKNNVVRDELTLETLEDISKNKDVATEEIVFGKRKISRKLI